MWWGQRKKRERDIFWRERNLFIYPLQNRYAERILPQMIVTDLFIYWDFGKLK
jgi:hypothetical protein